MEKKSATEATTAEWRSCPSGSLADFASQAKREARVRQVRRGLPLVAASIAVVAAGWIWLGSKEAGISIPSQEVQQVVYTCAEVKGQIEDYFHQGLAESDVLSIQDHLAKCEHCRQQYQQRAQELNMPLLISNAVPLLTCLSLLGRYRKKRI